MYVTSVPQRGETSLIGWGGKERLSAVSNWAGSWKIGRLWIGQEGKRERAVRSHIPGVPVVANQIKNPI